MSPPVPTRVPCLLTQGEKQRPSQWLRARWRGWEGTHSLRGSMQLAWGCSSGALGPRGKAHSSWDTAGSQNRPPFLCPFSWWPLPTSPPSLPSEPVGSPTSFLLFFPNQICVFKKQLDAHLRSQAKGRLKGGPARAGARAGLRGRLTARPGAGVSTLCALISCDVHGSCRQRGCGLFAVGDPFSPPGKKAPRVAQLGKNPPAWWETRKGKGWWGWGCPAGCLQTLPGPEQWWTRLWMGPTPSTLSHEPSASPAWRSRWQGLPVLALLVICSKTSGKQLKLFKLPSLIFKMEPAIPTSLHPACSSGSRALWAPIFSFGLSNESTSQ